MSSNRTEAATIQTEIVNELKGSGEWKGGDIYFDKSAKGGSYRRPGHQRVLSGSAEHDLTSSARQKQGHTTLKQGRVNRYANSSITTSRFPQDRREGGIKGKYTVVKIAA